MNKKIIVSVIIMLTTLPVFASGINANSATCNNSTLQTYTGTSNLSANWTPNTINITWYNDDTQFASNSCTYGGALTMPNSIPQKTGYTFVGWRVRQTASGICGLTSSAIDLNVSSGYSYDDYTSGTDKCYYIPPISEYTEIPCSNTNISDLGPQEWKVNSVNGTYKGIASCNNTDPGSDGYEDEVEEEIMTQLENEEITEEQAMNLLFYRVHSHYSAPANTFTGAETGGAVCWCKATGFTPNGDNQCSLSTLSWICPPNGAGGVCPGCATWCAFTFMLYPGVRHAILGIEP